MFVHDFCNQAGRTTRKMINPFAIFCNGCNTHVGDGLMWHGASVFAVSPIGPPDWSPCTTSNGHYVPNSDPSPVPNSDPSPNESV